KSCTIFEVILCLLFTTTLVITCVWPFFFFNAAATTEIYTLSLHDALPISFRSLTRATRPSRSRVKVRKCSRLRREVSRVGRPARAGILPERDESGPITL